MASIAIAKEQGARSPVLLASLSLAKLYQSTGRPADAHAVLAPALEGFSPTPEMPEIAEAQALLAAMAEMEEVRSAEAHRQRRLHLHTAYGQAMMWSKGFGAEETQAAFARAAELAAKSDDFSERFAAAHGQWTSGAHPWRTAAGARAGFNVPEGSGGRWARCGSRRRPPRPCIISYNLGEFAEARIHCERALASMQPPTRAGGARTLRRGHRHVAMSCLAMTVWQLGEIEHARELIDAANRRAIEVGHIPSMSNPIILKSYLEILRGDAAAALSAAEALAALGREHGMAHLRILGDLFSGWARGRLHDPAVGAVEVRQALAAYTDFGARIHKGFYVGLLAELEVATLGAASALARIDDALALAEQVDYRCDLAFLHRIRGEVLLKRDPAIRAMAEKPSRPP